MASLEVPDRDLKMLREMLCRLSVVATLHGIGIAEEQPRIQLLINEIDKHRPLGTDGKHGTLHTATCGCEDKPGRIHELECDVSRIGVCSCRRVGDTDSEPDECDWCGDSGWVEDPTACGDPDHCSPWMTCPNGCKDADRYDGVQ